MCGRFTQHRPPDAYASPFDWPEAAYRAAADARRARWNVAPGSQPWLMHRLADDEPCMEPVKWGYRPSWAAEKGLPIAINARIEKAATGAFFRGLWKAGRAIVPAEGWYEWTGEKGRKQPWYIRPKTGEPIFMAAITSHRRGKEADDNTGFVIVTAAAEGGLIDVHDRRPIVFAAADAALWMDNGFPPDQAESLARSVALPPDAFEWYEVSTEVNRVGHDSEALIEPV